MLLGEAKLLVRGFFFLLRLLGDDAPYGSHLRYIGATDRCRWVGGECPLLAEAVEKVGTIKFCATIVPVSHARSNFDSLNRGILNHCFKNFDLRDFFNTLGYTRTFQGVSQLFRFAPKTGHSSADVGFQADFARFTSRSSPSRGRRPSSVRDIPWRLLATWNARLTFATHAAASLSHAAPGHAPRRSTARLRPAPARAGSSPAGPS